VASVFDFVFDFVGKATGAGRFRETGPRPKGNLGFNLPRGSRREKTLE
jgi:hypothetical protein